MMKKLKQIRSFLFFAGAMLLGVSASAQVYPVQASVQLNPPYSLYLADYVESGTERLALNVFLNDIARPTLSVKFRLRIIGQGITLETKPEYNSPEYSLQGGINLRLTSSELAAYFNPLNLNFSGLNKREFEKTGKLPEGVYQFCFEVLEFNRGLKISNTACATAWLVLNDPPLINLPRQNEKLRAQDPQNVLLQWTPRHTGSPNASFSTEYDIRMVEVWPATRNPNDAILTSPPILETTTQSSSFLYGPSETPLEPGRKYAFRVRARSMTGLEEIDLFRNNGYSEVYSFIYGDACDLPTGINAEALSSSRFNLKWESKFNHTAFKVRYRPQGTSKWYETKSTINEVTVSSLEPGKTYEYEIAPSCGFFDGTYTTTGTITTMPAVEQEYSCGVPLDNLQLTPEQLSGSLQPGDIIQAGDFEVKLTKVTGSNGVFSGEGVVEVPYLNKAKVKTEFTNITINKDLRLVNGFLNVTGAGVDIVPQGVLDFMDDLTEVLDVVDSALNTIEDNLPEDFDPNSFVADTLITVQGGIQSVYKNDDGSVTVVSQSGNTQTLPAGGSYALKDDQGNGYLVDSKGNVHKVTADVATRAGSRVYDLKMTFDPNSLTRYGLEEKPHDALAQDYEQIGQYKVKWKSLAAGGTDQLNAILSEGTNAGNIQFEVGGQSIQTPPFSGGNASLTITGKSDGTVEGLLALIPSDSTNGKDKVVGKLNIVSYNAITPTLVIVPVGTVKLPEGLTAPIIQTELNKIYNQAVVDWKVSVADPLNYTAPNPFDNGESGLLSNYSADMRSVISAYGNLQDETYYLFLVNNPKNEGVGYMPRGKQSGFIYVDRHSGDEALLIRTIAHELGHGAFNLHHIFDEPNFTVDKGSSDNLMDYPAGDKLYKFQWDKIRYPDIVVGIFEEDEDAQYSTSMVYRCISTPLARNPNAHYKHFKGHVIKLGPNYEPYAFVGSGDQDDIVGSVAIVRRITDGKLYFPAKNDDTYTHYYARKTESTIDLTDFLKFDPVPNQVPTIVTINADSTYVIATGTVSVPGKELTGINCFGSGSLNPPNGIIVKSLLREEIKPEVLKKLTDLLGGKATNRITGEHHKIRGRMFLTSEIAADNVSALTVVEEGGKEFFFIDNVRQEVDASEVVFWLEYNAEGKIRVKKIIAGDTFDQGLAVALQSWDAQLEWKQKSFFQKFISASYELVDGYFTITYDMLDMLSSGIGHLKIPESVYNCNLPAGQYNPIYAKVFSYLNISAALQDMVAERLVQEYPEFAPILANGEPSQIQFALFCGVYNGLIGVVQSVPQLAQLLVSPLSSAGREANSEFLQAISDKEIYAQTDTGEQGELLYGKGFGFGKIWFLLSEGIMSQFKANTPCVTAHFVGEIIGPVIVMCIGDAAAVSGVASRVASTAIKILQICDKLGDPLHYAGLSFKFLKSGAGKLIVIVKNEVGDVIRQIDSDLFLVRVVYENTTLPELHLTSQQVEQLVAAGASGMNHVVDGVERRIVLAVSPGSLGSATAETISRQIFGNVSTEVAQALWKRFDDLGIAAVQVDRAMAALGKNADVVLDNGNKLATLLENAPFASTPSKLRELLDNIIAEPALHNLVKAGNDFTREWDVLYTYPIKRTDVGILATMKSILNKGHISRADIDEILRVNSGLKQRASPLGPFLLDLDNFAKYKGRTGYDWVISELKASWFNGAGADGANWIIDALRKQGDQIFPPTKTRFEVRKDIVNRRYDIVVDEGADVLGEKVSKFFELKSYSSVPPDNFSIQFPNDLRNPEITSLKQLVWLFDNAKNPPNFADNMKSAVRSLPDVSDDVLDKFNVATNDALKEEIVKQFNSIFLIK